MKEERERERERVERENKPRSYTVGESAKIVSNYQRASLKI